MSHTCTYFRLLFLVLLSNILLPAVIVGQEASLRYMIKDFPQTRSYLYANLPKHEKDIENSIVYRFDLTDEGTIAESSIDRNGNRYIAINQKEMLTLLMISDVSFITATYKNKGDFWKYLDYLSTAEENNDSIIPPYIFYKLSKEELVHYISNDGLAKRYNLYKGLFYFVISHEIAHHVIDGHLSDNNNKTGSLRDREVAADRWATKLLLSMKIVPATMLTVMCYFDIQEPEPIDFDNDKQHPYGMLRLWEVLNMYASSMDAFFSSFSLKTDIEKEKSEMLADFYWQGITFNAVILDRQYYPEQYYIKQAQKGSLIAQLKMANTHLKTFNTDSARHYLQLALKFSENNFAQYLMAFTYEMDGELEQAEEWYRRSFNNGNSLANRELDVFLIINSKQKLKAHYKKEITQMIINERESCISSCKTEYGYDEEHCLNDFCKADLFKIAKWIWFVRDKTVLN